jgi:hypothetical protein
VFVYTSNKTFKVEALGKKFIVITTVFEPTDGVNLFSKLTDYELVVIGDVKTPSDWSVDNVIYLSIDDQKKHYPFFANAIPHNHYSRKMIGYLFAIKQGANIIFDTDDDNIPKKYWNFPKTDSIYDNIIGDEGFVNIYNLFTNQNIWPRGLPLNLINQRFDLTNKIRKKRSKVGVWQGLVDNEPDVDAIYRLTNNSKCTFSNREPVVLEKGTIAPFNSQNTLFCKDLFPLLYLPTQVSFRFTDILRGLIAQPIMWLYDYQLGFTDANVFQIRNPHNYINDFVSEIPMYIHTEKVIDLVNSCITSSESLKSNLINAYRCLANEKIVPVEELKTLEIWLKEV